jgi:hypothetical protein
MTNTPLTEYVTSSEEADWDDSSDSEDRARMMLAEDEASRAAEMQTHDQMDGARDLAGRMASSDDTGDLGRVGGQRLGVTLRRGG